MKHAGLVKPCAPDFKDKQMLLEHLRFTGQAHFHRKRNERYVKGYVWQMAFRQTKRCGTDQCVYLPVR
jgi:hypothetical protein